jgi:hypothetical protein
MIPSPSSNHGCMTVFDMRLRLTFVIWLRRFILKGYETHKLSQTDKVKRQIVTQDYLKGGLKMVEIIFFFISLKCTWIKRLTNSHKP